MKKIANFLLFLALVSCATTQEQSKGVEQKKSNKNLRVQKHLVDSVEVGCNGCIKGSAGDNEIRKSGKKSYFLFGAEHLNLKNKYFDIPVVYNKYTKMWIKYFTGRGKKSFKRYAKRSGRYGPVLSKILNNKNMPRDLIYLAMAESGFQNHARSWAKAVGPWQFMPFTGRKFGLEVGFFLDERRDPLKATVAASDYLTVLYDMFGSWELAMAGYNAGEGKIKRAIRRYRTKNFWKIRKGRYLRAETKNYVPKIMALAIIGKNLESFGFDDIEFDKPLDFEEITVLENTDLYNLASVIGTSFKEIKKYNPELTRWQVPPKKGNYKVRVPVGIKKNWDLVVDKTVVQANDYKIYQLKGYASLKHVSRKFKVPVKILETLNGFPKNKRLFPKTAIRLPFRADHSRKNRLYADLYEKPRKSVRRRRAYQRWIRRGMKKGRKIASPKQFYTVKKGDNLWSIARKTGVGINTIIRSNHKLVKRRMILPGDKLAIK
ncbi:MAG: transglycosylase SLT domain-containing protein [Bacteriovoracaceae bacterium]|nr:transglycosylase SLT domain-containing protein [Bacteriovoracaceae bacterium]